MRHPGKHFQSKIWFAFVLACLLICSLTHQYLGHDRSSQGNVDFYAYYFAAQVVHDNPHASLYEGAAAENPEIHLDAPAASALSVHARAAGFDKVMFYVYPPLLADLLAPLSRIPVHLAEILWRVFNLVLVFASVLLLARIFRVPILGFEFAVLALAAYSFFPIHETVFLGQITIVLLALWTIGIVAYFDDRMVLSAAAFALATAFKVTPILLLPLFFIWKDRRWILSYLAVTVGLVAVMVSIRGFDNGSIDPAGVAAMGGGIPASTNKTLGSLADWVYYGRIFDDESAHTVIANIPRALSILAKLASGALYVCCLLLAWRSRRIERASRAATIAIFGLITACASPVTWRHGYSIAFIPLAIFWVRALRTPHGPFMERY